MEISTLQRYAWGTATCRMVSMFRDSPKYCSLAKEGPLSIVHGTHTLISCQGDNMLYKYTHAQTDKLLRSKLIIICQHLLQ